MIDINQTILKLEKMIQKTHDSNEDFVTLHEAIKAIKLLRSGLKMAIIDLDGEGQGETIEVGSKKFVIKEKLRQWVLDVGVTKDASVQPKEGK
jgi:DNA replicative helicase MCM subunit Mcm2 (Cdc46/Mcm family)